MRALSIMQPWASLIVGGPLAEGTKRIENRTWRPPAALLGERIAIHASKSHRHVDYRSLLARHWWRPELWPYRTPGEFPRSAIVGVATIQRVFTMPLPHEGADWTEPPTDLPADQVRWWVGPVGLLLSDVRRIEPITKVNGALGFWRVASDYVDQIGARL